jgi:hypothetical protein
MFNTCITLTIMEVNNQNGWKKLLTGYPWFACNQCYPVTAYSEYMPSPLLGYKPYGKPDQRILSEEDLYGWKISELEEEYELKPGIEHIGKQIMTNITKLGKGLPQHFISGHGGENLSTIPTGLLNWQREPDIFIMKGLLHFYHLCFHVRRMIRAGYCGHFSATPYTSRK